MNGTRERRTELGNKAEQGGLVLGLFVKYCRATFFTSVLLSSAGADASSCKLGYVGEAPMRVGPSGLHVTVGINGHEVDMRLATGDWWTMVTASVADQAGLIHVEDTGSHLAATGYNNDATGVRNLHEVSARHVTFANTLDNGVRMLVMEKRNGQPDRTDDNYLGNRMLGAFDVDFDTVGGRLILYTAENSCASPKAYLTGTLYTTPILTNYGEDRRTPEISVKFGDQVIRAYVASDVLQSVITPQAAARLGVSAAALAADPKVKLFGLGSYTPQVPRHMFTNVAFGDITFSKMPLLVFDDEDHRGVDMQLGADFMRQVHVWISNSSHTLIMQVPPAASPVVQAKAAP